MVYVKLFEEYINDAEIIVKIGDYVLTRKDIETKYKDKISKYYGEYTEDTIIEATWTLNDIANFYDNGGELYRVVWLENINDFDSKELGHHWVSCRSDVENIVDIFNTYRESTDTGEPYVIKSYTPPNNVSVPYDYWNNLDEHEILVVDDKKLVFVEIQKY